MTNGHLSNQDKRTARCQLAEWFDNMDIVVSEDEDGATVTSMTGLVVDQVALHGLLARIRDLNLQLLSVQCLDSPPPTSG